MLRTILRRQSKSLPISLPQLRFSNALVRYSTSGDRKPSIDLNYFQHKQQREEAEFKKYQEKEQRRLKIQRYAMYVISFIVGTGGFLIYFQPWHPYSSEVAKLLRKALWAESNKDDFDYSKALMYYQQAVKQCEKEGIDQISNDYTGIVLKVAQMYEKLGKVEDQRRIYLKLSEFLFSKLVNLEIPEDKVDDIIKRDLSVFTRLLEISDKRDTEKNMQELWDRIVFAEQRVGTKWGVRLSPKPTEREMNVVEVLNIKSRSDAKTFSKKRLSKESNDFLFGSWLSNPEWPLFTEELISARDLYGTLCMVTNRYQLAVNIFKSNLLWMKLSRQEPIFLGTTMTNLASSYYLKMERHEGNVRLIAERIARQRKLREEGKDKEYVGENGEKVIDDEILVRASDSEKIEARRCAKQVERIYHGTIDYFQNNGDSDLKVEACVSMSYYGLGVLMIHEKDNLKALEYFQESRSKAVESEIDQLVDQVDSQLKLIETGSKATETTTPIAEN